jgi:anti-sigma-K factor RskA
MSTTIEPQDLDALLAAHALGALDDVERAAVERALAEDPAARARLAKFEKATGLLPSADGPGTDVWSKIEAAISDGERRPVVVPIESGRRASALGTRRRVVRVVGFAAAAAAVLALALWGVGTMDQSYAPNPAASVRRAAEAAVRADGARTIVLTTQDGSTVELVVLPDGSGFVVRGDLPVSDDSLYRLVGITDDGPVLLALIGDRIRPTAFQLPPDVTDIVLQLGLGDALASTSFTADRGESGGSAPSDAGSVPPGDTGGSSTPGQTPTAPPTQAPPSPGIPLPTLPPLLPPIDLPLLDLSLF